MLKLRCRVPSYVQTNTNPSLGRASLGRTSWGCCWESVHPGGSQSPLLCTPPPPTTFFQRPRLSQGSSALVVPGTLRRTRHWACSGGSGPGGSPRLHLAVPPPASRPRSTWRRPAGGGDGAGRRCAFPSRGPTFPPYFPSQGVQSLDRGLRRLPPRRGAEFLEGGARGCPPYGLLGHLIPSGRGEPRS